MIGLTWTVNPDGRLQHVVPDDDTYPHLVSMGCWCHPQVELDDTRVVMHRSADGREDFESGTRLMS